MIDPWEPLGARFVDDHYSSLHGRVRAYVIDQHLRAHLPSAPAAVVDVGGGAGTLSIPLARRGYDVTIVDPSPAMRARATAAAEAEHEDARRRIEVVAGRGEDVAVRFGSGVFDAVLCHGVLMYLDDPGDMVAALCEVAAPAGMVSIVAKNREALAVRPAAEGRWGDALAAFDATGEVNRLGLDTRADSVDELSALLERHSVAPIAWYGVRLFTDNLQDDAPLPDDEAACFAVELEASRRDPYRRLSRLFQLIGRKE